MGSAASTHPHSVAVVGMAGRFPGARDVAEYWRNLCAGVESVVRYADQDLLDAGEDPSLLGDPHYVRAGAPLADVELFDAGFFGFSAREAAILDPQHRHFLEVCWEALEDAGHMPELFPGAIGVFAGAGMQDYYVHHLAPNRKLMREVGPFLVRHTGNDKDFLTTRVSYCLNLTGPSVAVQTACSTSLVAIHMAVQSLLNGECDLALAGGVTIQLPHRVGYVFHDGEILSPDGHCRAFDREARGTIFGSGVGVVVLRRAEEALKDRDTVYALVRGTAVNNDGRGKVSYLAPSLDGQARCVAEALALAGVPASSIGYVEAHGTGTPVGDPIEVAALTQAFGLDAAAAGGCAIGSVKTNVGHLDTAAGVASFIKAALSLKHRLIPPSLNFAAPNPACAFEQSPFHVNRSLTAWVGGDAPRRACVNSLGVGGTNAHVVLEEPPEDPVETGGDPTSHLLCLSARSPAALERSTERLAAFLRTNPERALGDVAYTLQVGRRAFACRRTVVAAGIDDAVRQLEASLGTTVRAAPETAPPVVFMFPGGGAQYPSMGRELYASEPVFRERLDRVLAIGSAGHGLNIVESLFPAPGDEARAAAMLEGASRSLLATFAVGYAMAHLWRSRGIEPAALVGHSLGELTAACVAGVMSLSDTIAVVAARGRVLDGLPSGATVAVGLSEQALGAYLTPELSVAAVNGPALCVVSGSLPAVAALESTLAERGIDVRRLRLSFAAHSALLDGHLDAFAEAIGGVRLQPPDRPLVSNVTGDWAVANQVTTADYWVRQLRQPVRFADGLSRVLDQLPGCVLLEVGPGTTLTSLALQQRGKVQARCAVASMRHPEDASPDQDVLLGAVGRLWSAGVGVDWTKHRPDESGRRISLPTYPFERQRHWIDRPSATAIVEPAARAADVTTSQLPAIDDWFAVPSWRPARLQPAAASRITWLVFDSGDTLHDAIRHGLSARGDKVVRASRGTSYEAHTDGSFVIRPGERVDYDHLLAALAARALQPSRVAHLWGLGAAASRSEGIEVAADLSFYSLLFLAQAWDQRQPSEPLHLAIVSSGMQCVGTEPLTDPARALALGPCLVIPSEYPALSCSSIDWAPGDGASSLDALVTELRAEVPEPVVALRAASRWVPSQERRRLPARESAATDALKPRGVYLVTGGFGGLGLAVAEHLARTVKARLVLTGPSGLPDRADWPRLLVECAPVSERIRRVVEIERLGGEVLAIRADVSDAAQMDAAATAAIARFGEVDGIFHAAGVLDDGPVAVKTRESAGRVLRPKVHGTLVLDSILERCRPDFAVLFSSISALVAVPGQVDYAAANAFLNAYAGSRRDRGVTRVVAIDWAAWREVGMAADAQAGTEGVPVSHPLLGRRREFGGGRKEYSARVGPDTTWLLDEHRLDGSTSVLPGTAYIEIVRAAVGLEAPGQALAIDELLLLVPLSIEAGAECDLRITVDAVVPSEAWTLSIASRSGAHAGWVENARARARRLDAAVPNRLDVPGLSAACDIRDVIAGPSWRSGQERRLTLGSRWRCLQRIRLGRDVAMIELALPPALADDAEVLAVHPALLDQAVGGALPLIDGYDQRDDFYVPMAFEGVRIWQPLPPSLRVRAGRLAAEDGTAAFELTVADETGIVLLEIERLTLRRIDATTTLVPRGLPGRGAAEPEGQASMLQALLAGGIDTASGLAALDRILAHSDPGQIVVSPLTLAEIASNLADLATALRTERGHAPSRRLVAPRTDAERQIAALWSRALGVDAVGVEDNWFELGGHSLLGIRVLSQLRRTCDVDLPPHFFFESPTIAEQARSIERILSTPPALEADRLVPVGREQFRRPRHGSRP